MDMLAKNIAAKLQSELAKEDALVLNGETLQYKKVFMGKIIEEFIEGGFKKEINNNGELSVNDSEILKKAESLAHFSYERSEKELMILDKMMRFYFQLEICQRQPSIMSLVYTIVHICSLQFVIL